MEIFTKKYIKEFFQRNKKLLLASLIFFIIVFIAGAIFGYMAVDGHTGQISSGLGETNTDGDVFLSSLDLFIHNFSSDLATIAFGLLLSIMSLVITAINAGSIGYIFGIDIPLWIFGIAPHGIFEYSASIFALTGAFILTKLEINIIKSILSKNYNIKEIWHENELLVKDTLLIICITFVLLIIAAIIEGHITPIIFDIFF